MSFSVILSIIFLSLLGIVIIFIVINALIQKVFYLAQIPNSKTPRNYDLAYNEYLFEGNNKQRLQLWDLNPHVEKQVILGVSSWFRTADSLLDICKPLLEDYRIFLLNARNHGQSSHTAYLSIKHYNEDIISSIDYIRSFNGNKNLILIGHSFGSAAIAYSSVFSSFINGMVLLSPVAELHDLFVQRLLRQHVPPVFHRSILNYIEFIAGESFDNVNIANIIRNINYPVLTIFSEKDEIIPKKHMNAYSEIAEINKKLVFSVIANLKHSETLTDKKSIKQITQFLKTNFN